MGPSDKPFAASELQARITEMNRRPPAGDPGSLGRDFAGRKGRHALCILALGIAGDDLHRSTYPALAPVTSTESCLSLTAGVSVSEGDAIGLSRATPFAFQTPWGKWTVSAK